MAIIAKQKYEDRLISKDNIKEDMVLIDESDVDYITRSGRVYKYYGNNMFYPRKTHTNIHNGYVYVSIECKDGVKRSRRLHVLLARHFIQNKNPKIYNIVGHYNNIKSDNRIENLYWTTNQLNVQKAIDDGLNVSKRAEKNKLSIPVKVLDKDTKEVVGIYGSIGECGRCIENVDKGFITKVIDKGMYRPRSRKYIYTRSSIDEFNQHPDLQNIKLIETKKVSKNPKVFRMTNNQLGFDMIMDNQKEAENICGIHQATISQYIKQNDLSSHNGWVFEYIGEKEYAESSGFKKLLNQIDRIVIQNIYTNEVKIFDSYKELKECLGLKGHDFNQYINTGQTILSEWKFVDKIKKL